MTIHDQLTANFYRWEQRGRGVDVFPAAVELEPPFLAFPGHRLRLGNERRDSGVKPSLFSGLANKVFRALQPPNPGAGGKLEIEKVNAAEPEWQEPEPDWFGEKEPVVEFRLVLPGGASYGAEAMGHYLLTQTPPHGACALRAARASQSMSAPASRSRSLLLGLMGLEIIGTESEVWVQVVCQSADAALVAQQLMAQFPEVKITWGMENLLSVWGQSVGMGAWSGAAAFSSRSSNRYDPEPGRDLKSFVGGNPTPDGLPGSR